jgi:hypothetical protein
MATEEPNPTGAPRPKSQDYGTITYIHGVKPIRRNKEGQITDGDVEPKQAKYLPKFLGLGNTDDTKDYILQLIHREQNIWNDTEDSTEDSIEIVKDSLSNDINFLLKTSVSKDKAGLDQMVTNISIAESEQRIGEIKKDNIFDMMNKKIRGR